MLNALRNSAGSWVVRGFLFIIVVSFAVWGIGDLGRVRPDTAAVEVGDVEISGAELQQAFQRDLRQLQASLGNLTQEQALRAGLAQGTLQRLIGGALYQQAADELGLTAPDAAIREQIVNNPAFYNELGRFDAGRFEALLRQNGFTEAGYVALSRREQAQEQLRASIVRGAAAPDSMVRAFYSRQQERRAATLLRVPDATVTDVPAPTEEQLAAYHEAHEAAFTAPEFRALTYAMLAPEDLADEIAVSAEDLQAAYRSRLYEFSTPEERAIEQILVQDEATADAAAARLAEGEDFYAVASAVAGLDAATVKLGTFTRSELPLAPAMTEAIFALEEGGVSEPLQSALGWDLFRVAEVTPGHDPPLEEVKERLASDLRLERASEAIFDLANEIDDALAGGASIEEAAQQFNLRSGQVEAVDATGRDPAGEPVRELPRAPDFLETAFSIEPGQEPLLHETDTRGYYLVRVDEVTEPRLRPLDEVREQVADAWTAERREELAAERATALAERAREGAALSALAAETGGEVVETEALTHEAFAAETDVARDLAAALFDAEPGAVVTGETASGAGHVVARLSGIEAAEPEADEDGVQRMAEVVAESLRNDLWTQFRGALAQRYEVQVNDRVVQSVFAPPDQ